MPPVHRPRSPSRPAAPPREVRIIGGQWKRTRLPVPDTLELRPTLDRVRETLFNWLGQDLDGWRCLDAFAGTGALGFEAASRGAARVVLLERDPALLKLLQATRERLSATMVEVVRADALAWMQRAPAASFDLVFLDPPFAAGLFERALQAAARLLVPGGYAYVESGEPLDEALLAALPYATYREGRAGAVHFRLLQRR
jgi:16S rRNA (guanine966-N2)-methyltransferase